MIYVIGASNIDIYSKSNNDIVYKDSNIGKIDITYGGVGNNIACNLNSLKENVKFITAIGDDYFSKLIIDDLNNNKIDYSLSKVFNNQSSSIYLAVLDKNNDLAIGINDMNIIDCLDVDYFKVLKDLVNDDDYLILDCNLSEDTLKYILNEIKGKKIVETISTNKINRIIHHLNKIDLIKMNLLEASSLCGVNLNDENKIISFMKLMKKEGVKEVLISSRNGLYIGNDKGVQFYKHYLNDVNVINASGAGDALFSAYIYGKYHNLNDKSCASIGLISALITLSDRKTKALINKDIIKEKMKEIKINGGYIYEY